MFNLKRLKPSQITAVSIETAFQNGGIAFVLLKISLPEPYGDLAAVPPGNNEICIFIILSLKKNYYINCTLVIIDYISSSCAIDVHRYVLFESVVMYLSTCKYRLQTGLSKINLCVF